MTISLRSIRDRDHQAGYTNNNAAQPSVSISGKTLSGTITRPVTAMSFMGHLPRYRGCIRMARPRQVYH